MNDEPPLCGCRCGERTEGAMYVNDAHKVRAARDRQANARPRIGYVTADGVAVPADEVGKLRLLAKEIAAVAEALEAQQPEPLVEAMTRVQAELEEARRTAATSAAALVAARADGDEALNVAERALADCADERQSLSVASRRVEELESLLMAADEETSSARAERDAAAALTARLREELAGSRAGAGELRAALDSALADRCELRLALAAAERDKEALATQLAAFLEHVRAPNASLSGSDAGEIGAGRS